MGGVTGESRTFDLLTRFWQLLQTASCCTGWRAGRVVASRGYTKSFAPSSAVAAFALGSAVGHWISFPL